MENDDELSYSDLNEDYNLGMMDTLNWVRMRLWDEPDKEKLEEIKMIIESMISDCEERRAFAFYKDLVEPSQIMVEHNFARLRTDGTE